MATTLVIPDAHVEPNQDLRRMEFLGKLIVDRLPDRIIFMGDYGSFESLSHWDQNKRLIMEGRRYQSDVEWCNYGLDIVDSILELHQDTCRKQKKKMYRPEKHFLFGNHEEWVERYVEQHPEMEDFMDVETDLDLKGRGYASVPYRTPLLLNGISYCHVPMAQNNRPIGGKFFTSTAWARHHKPVIFGHTHRFQVFGDKRIDGEQTTEAISSGCFYEHQPKYSKGAECGVWKGVMLLTQWTDSEFDFERISIARMRSEYFYG